MDHAIVLACGTGYSGEKLGNYIRANVAQVPQIKRILINTQRAGIKSFTICLDKDDPGLKEAIEDDRRIQSQIQWLENGSAADINSTRSLIIPSNILVDTSVVEQFINTKTNGENGVVSVQCDNPERIQGNGHFPGNKLGLAAAGKNEISDLLKKPDMAQWINTLVSENKVDFVKTDKGYWMSLNGNRERFPEAEQLIFSTVGKTATGWIARNINGRISLPISRQLIKTPLTPNMISILINVIGALSGPFYALGHPVVGALFMQFATVLDRCDGEVARIKLMETKKGQWVDTLSDQVTVFSFIVGSSIGYYLQSGNTLAIVMGGINLSIFIFFLIWSLYFIARFTDSGSLVAYFEVDKFVDTKNTSLVRKIIAFLRPLGRRNVYSLAFLIFAIVGGYPLVVGVLTFALILFLLHQLEDIVKIFKLKH